MKTRINEMFGIQYPIICGGMAHVGTAELAAAVSNAGGLGQITAGEDKDFCKREINRTRELTQKPFAVNIPLNTDRWDPDVLIQTVIEEQVPIVTTSAGNPQIYIQPLHAAGIKVMHVIASVRHAIKAELAGVDVVVAEGVESGGACSFDEITTLVLVPQVVDAVKCPVIAAGGIGDARGMVATFALGAEGIQLGTRFVVTHECIAHPSYKDKILQAKDTDTILTGKTVGPMRCLKNAMSEEATKMERQGASPEQMLAFYGLGRAHKGIVEGDVDHGTLYAGEICGMFTRLMSSQEVIQSFVNGWEAIIKRLSKLQ